MGRPDEDDAVANDRQQDQGAILRLLLSSGLLQLQICVATAGRQETHTIRAHGGKLYCEAGGDPGGSGGDRQEEISGAAEPGAGSQGTVRRTQEERTLSHETFTTHYLVPHYLVAKLRYYLVPKLRLGTH